jgi:uncharacterized RDD family membrane protein YckC
MRWREVKQGRVKPASKAKPQTQSYATYPQRIKAFIVDMFMIYTPILYIITYFILGGKEDFQSSQAAPLAAVAIYGLIYAVFLAKKGQTPGKKAYEIKVVDKNGHNLSFAKALLRFCLFLFSATIIIGLLTPFFRSDKKALHDIILGSKEIALEK